MGVKPMSAIELLTICMTFTFLLQCVGCWIWYIQSQRAEKFSQNLHERIAYYEGQIKVVEQKNEQLNEIGYAFEAMYIKLDQDLTWNEFLKVHNLRELNQ